MKPRATSESPIGSSGSWNAFVSSRHSDRWVCIPDPWTPSSGLGMKVACTPELIATSRTIMRNAMRLSDIPSASV